ncbi:reverse transcriptase domain protein [Apiospora arundinis]
MSAPGSSNIPRGKAPAAPAPPTQRPAKMDLDSDEDSDDGVSRKEHAALAERLKDLQQENENYRSINEDYLRMERELHALKGQRSDPGPTTDDLEELRKEVRLLRAAANIIKTPVAPKEGVKISAPSPFDGTSGNLRGFLVQVKAYQKFYEGTFKDSTQKVVHAASFLKGKALSWFEPYLNELVERDWQVELCRAETQQIFDSYDGFEDALKGKKNRDRALAATSRELTPAYALETDDSSSDEETIEQEQPIDDPQRLVGMPMNELVNEIAKPRDLIVDGWLAIPGIPCPDSRHLRQVLITAGFDQGITSNYAVGDDPRITPTSEAHFTLSWISSERRSRMDVERTCWYKKTHGGHDDATWKDGIGGSALRIGASSTPGKNRGPTDI